MLTIFSRENCPSCQQAKALLTQSGIVFKEEVIGIHILRETFIETFPNVKTVPLILDDDGIIIGGFEDLKEFLNNENDGSQLLNG